MASAESNRYASPAVRVRLGGAGVRAPQWLYLTFTPLQAEELYELAARRFLSPHKLGQGTENLIRPLSLARANDYSEFLYRHACPLRGWELNPLFLPYKGSDLPFVLPATRV